MRPLRIQSSLEPGGIGLHPTPRLHQGTNPKRSHNGPHSCSIDALIAALAFMVAAYGAALIP